MTHLATADSEPDFAAQQLERFAQATEPYAHLTRHAANSAAALRIPDARFDAARCGIALYGVSPFDTDPAEDGLKPALSWRSHIAQVKQLQPGESTGYGRRFVATEPAWIGIVPIGYADGFRRDMTGTEVLVDGEPRRAIGTVSMDAFAVELERELPQGTPVTIVGDGLLDRTPCRAGRDDRLRDRVRDQQLAGTREPPRRGLTLGETPSRCENASRTWSRSFASSVNDRISRRSPSSVSRR